MFKELERIGKNWKGIDDGIQTFRQLYQNHCHTVPVPLLLP